jgi:leucyl aminopeptidase
VSAAEMPSVLLENQIIIIHNVKEWTAHCINPRLNLKSEPGHTLYIGPLMPFLAKKTATAVPIIPLTTETLERWLKKQDKALRSWIEETGFTASPGAMMILPTTKGTVARVLYGVKEDGGLYDYASLPARLAGTDYGFYIDAPLNKEQATQAALGWALGCYHFSRYKSGDKKKFASLVWPAAADKKVVQSTADAIYLVRDLVNTPANDMGPAELAAAAKKVAGAFKGTTVKIIVGEDLLKKNYPAVHAVGKGSPRAPRFIDIRWGNKKNPAITLIGKGVCFDTGGLNIKPGNSMFLMKKDMGGAAHALGLAQMIMSHNLPIYLRVLIPAVENSTGGNSYRPSDIIQTRKGLSIEIGDTDAEGRLILADALSEASDEIPALIIDFATLTGAARVALGPELPAMFCNNDKIAGELAEIAIALEDPLWRLPLWQPYKDLLGSKVADSNNIGNGPAGAIIAALFLEKFVSKGIPWIHIDTYAWNVGSKPGRPEGGEALGMRAAFELIKKRFGKK